MTVKCCGSCKSSAHIVPDVPLTSLWCYLVDEPVQYDEQCDSWSEE